ncbi:hypothetical protein BPMI_01667c [Candidatus Burkholderia pumila]|uniref:Uncharacterized protein n=1 Tax=Candidatus Burkholderia pumila TaxID=1090375 RepID=A0ABR5HJV2_9BURK|nr:hypothetical protein BPMI_01667c [Candidatus Burkholderia pumila]
MVTINFHINGRDIEAELTPGLRVILRETNGAEVAFSISEAFAALLPQGPEFVLRSTVDDAIRALVLKHAQAN